MIKEKKVKASYNFKKKQKVERRDNIDGVAVVYPEVSKDASKYIMDIKNKEPLIVSIEYCQKEEVPELLAYLNGAMEVAGGQVVELEKDKYYVLLPEDMEIEE